jgi:dihydroxy-acid dehydratase
LPTIGDGRQSGTSDNPSIVHASPESAAGGALAWLRSGDMIRIDLNAGRCDMLVSEAEIEERRKKGLPSVPPAQTPWQKIYRQEATQLSDGAVLRSADGFHQIGRTLPRHNH